MAGLSCSEEVVMNKVISILVYVFLVTLSYQMQGWRGIVPLHSTREDVERLIGSPMKPNGITYDLKNERVNITYSDGGCAKGQPSEWNVPYGTVIGITVYPQTRLLLSDLHMDLDGFEKFVNPHNPDLIYYSNKEKGISVGTRSNGEVISTQYFPGAKDSQLHCHNSSAREPNLEARKFDEYSDLPFKDEKARLDNLASYLRERRDLIGYVIVYAGQQAHTGEAKARAERAKSYLVSECGLDSGRVVIIYDGHREKLTFELYAMPRSASPPASTSTVNP